MGAMTTTAATRSPVRQVARWAAILLVPAMLIAACGDANDDGADSEDSGAVQTTDDAAGGDGPEETAADAADGKLTQITAAIPFPAGIPFYPIIVAEERGYLAEEGIELTNVEAVDGSGAVVQQLVAGTVDIGFPSPSPLLTAVEAGEDLVSVYVLYQQNVFSIVVPEDSDVQSLADLKGGTMGFDSLDAGGADFTRAILSAEHGLEADVDYEQMSVGDGGTATVALTRGEVDAYTAAFPDVATMRLRGLELRNIMPDDYQSFPDSLLVVSGEMVESSPELVEGLGRAMAKATEWSQGNLEEVLRMTSAWFPEEAEDEEFALALLEETASLFQPTGDNHRWGYHDPEAFQAYHDFLREQGQIEGTAGLDPFVNEFVPAFNDFDEGDL